MVKARGIDNKIDSLVAIPVTKTRRTLIVPNQAIATYVTQWTYDSHNRLIEMIYPDEEKVTYSYNLGGLLEKVRGEKSYGYDYITKLGYDKFEQRSYLKYCNGAETFYTYDDRRRLSNLAVNSGGTSIMDNAYTFDAVSNVLSVANNASLPANGNAGGQMSHTYTYDGLYRLATATGTYTGADNKSASYTLAMGYDNMHRIKSKSQHLTQDNVQFNGTLNVGYDLTYTYGSEAGKKFQLESVKDVNYRTEETPEGQKIENGHKYKYDKNGNLIYVNTNRVMTDGHRDNSVGERKLIWDEENRLLAVDDNGFVSNYWYDADGERTVKTSGESDQVYVNGVFSGGSTNTAKFSLYVSPYLVANQGGRYTKHIYAGSQRIVSKVGDFASYGSDPRRIEYAGANTDGLSVDYKSKYAAQQQVIKDNYKFFDVPYNGTDNDNYADGEGFCCNDGSMEAAIAEARKAQARTVSRSFKDPDNYENLQFFYHPDHLGSSSFITNLDGEVVQHIEYVPFGEVFIEERNNVWNTPYLFNAKEFDEETGMYYYGARYYEPRLSLWMTVDPLCVSDLIMNNEDYLDGEHNGGVYNPYNNNPYIYCYQNPIRLIDPNGKQVDIILPENPDNIDLSVWEKYQPERHNGHLRYWRHRESGVFLAYDNDPQKGSHYHLYKDSRFNVRLDSEGVQSGTKLADGKKLSKGAQRFHLKGGAKLNMRAIQNGLKGSMACLGFVSVITEVFRMATNHPDALFSTINPTGSLNTLYGVSTGNGLNNMYYEITSRSKDASSIYINIYESYYYDHDSKRYRGLNQRGTAVLNKTEKGYVLNQTM